MATKTSWPLGDLLEEFPIRLPSGRTLQATLYRSTTRSTGRRVVVRENGECLYDSDECHDWANAANGLDRWLATLVVQNENVAR